MKTAADSVIVIVSVALPKSCVASVCVKTMLVGVAPVTYVDGTIEWAAKTGELYGAATYTPAAPGAMVSGLVAAQRYGVVAASL